MPEQMAGFPYWQFELGEQGQRVAVPDLAGLSAELTAAGVTDLFVFSHGWNNSRDAARDLYRRFFQSVADASRAGGSSALKAGVTIGVVGVIWPAMGWADEPTPGTGRASGAGGAAGVGGAAGPAAPALSDGDLVRQLKAVFTDPAQLRALDELAVLLQTRPADDASLRRFQQLMAPLMAGNGGAVEDGGQKALVEKDHREVFERMAIAGQQAGVTDAATGGGAAGLGGVFGTLWEGAKQALRQATYWQMKQRAGVVGQNGLGPLLGDLHARLPNLRLHLIGHSFGARLVSFSLAGLPAASQGGASPIKSLTLLQGAFSHFSFARSLPQDRARHGALFGLAGRVDGPVLASFTDRDTAVGVLYPAASIVAGQDASAFGDPLYPWGAMGHDGAQAVAATTLPFDAAGAAYPFAAGRFYNLDGNQLIVNGGPPAGAHGDICHVEIGWAALVAAGAVTR